MKKKVIFFHPYFSDGGVERTNIGIAKKLIDEGHSVEFLTTEYTDHFYQEIIDSGIELNSLGGGSVSKKILALRQYLNRASDESKVVFISCQYYVNVISMFVSLSVRNRKSIKFVNSERNHIDEFKTNGGIKNNLVRLLVKLTYRFSDLIIANSSETANDLSRFINRPVLFAYNPTINKRLLQLSTETVYEEWFLRDNRPCIIGVGRLSKQKGFDTLIKAFSGLDKHYEYKLVILGEGSERSYLNSLIDELGLNDDVYLPGFVKNPYKFIKSAELFVLSSRYEGLPNALIESLYLSTPSLSTSCKSGPSEILDNDYFLTSVDDEVMMGRKMELILRNKERFHELDFDLNRFSEANASNDFYQKVFSV